MVCVRFCVMPSFGQALITNSTATGVQSTAATLAGQVTSTSGGTPTVTLFYGLSDGSTNAGSWANNVAIGSQSSAYTQPVSGLSPGKTYYFTARAVNGAGTTWAKPSFSFQTLGSSQPQIANGGATAVGGTLATLNGQVLSTGGSSTTVNLFYGTNDGGANATGWSNTFTIGVQSGAFAQPIAALVTNQTYYFTAQASNAAGVTWAAPSQSFTTLATNPPSALTSVLTYHNDNTRWGANTNETILTLANVNTNTFGKLFTLNVDGFVYAQPLVVPNVNIPGKGAHNVVFVATEHNTVYAFDADSNTGVNSTPLWQTSFLGPGITTVPAGVVGSTDITPEIGITSTPVIDPVTGTLYVAAKTLEPGSNYVHRLHALDIGTGLERTNFGSPIVITCTNYPGVGNGASGGQFADNDGQNPPHLLWNPLRQFCRAAMTLLNGKVYLSFASHGDTQPYHGWFFGYNATNLSVAPAVYNCTPNGFEGGFWAAGGGPSADSQGNLYFQSGNGSFNGGSTVTATNNYSMSMLKLATTNGLTLVDYFAPSNAVALSSTDQDLGASAPIILPDSVGSVAHPRLVVGFGKTPPVYLVDRDNMGRFNGTGGNNLIVQQFNGGAAGDRDITPAFFNSTLYMIEANWYMAAFKITNALFNTTPVIAPERFDNRGGATPSISANGNSNAILWAIYNAGGASPTLPCILRAYNATNLTQKLYSTDQLTSRDVAGNAVKFTVPTIANGKVYVGAQYALTVYGIAQGFVSTPTISPNGGQFTNSVLVTLSDATAGASIFYTLDGSIPTTNSAPYSAPFTLTNSGTVTARAFKSGAVASSAVSAGFLNISAVGTGTGLTGMYYSNQVATFNPPATLTRTDATINFNWLNTSPAPFVSPTNFSVRWSGTVQPQYNETYTIHTWSEDGVRLWINGQLLINHWSNQPPTHWSGSVPMLAQQQYNIQLEYYYQTQGTSVVQLSWSSPSTPEQIIPQSQLYPAVNPPPVVQITLPASGTVLTAPAAVTLQANAAGQSNDLATVAFYLNGLPVGSLTDPPYALTVPGVAAGEYSLTAVATDTTGLSGTSAPVNITVAAGSGLPYGMTNYPTAPAYYNMPSEFSGSLPALLSQTGVFTNTPNMSPAASLIPYSPNTPLWSDGALKIRYVSVPNSGLPFIPDTQIHYAPTGTWSFPAGTVFVKTFELLTNQNDPSSILRLETRLLVRDLGGAVYGVTYKWRPDGSDADLLTTSQTQLVSVATSSGTFTQSWYYPSPNDCLQCHTPVANYVLGLNTRQLNGSFGYPNGVTDNQLRTLNRLGLLYPAINESSISNIAHLSAITNLSASLEERARSYLDANCAQCHQPGGSGPTFDGRYDTPLSSQNIINILAVKGNLGYDNVHIVTPKDVLRSSIYDRMNSVVPNVQMPTLARSLIDTGAVQLMADWINSLPGTPALNPPALIPAGGTFAGPINITAVPPTNNVTMYYTLNGTLPTTNSTLYTGPILVASNLTVNINAWATGYVNSVVGSASYTILPGVYITSSGSTTNGIFQMTLTGPVGGNYVLQTSTNLQQWISISTNTPASSPFVLTDPGATNAPIQFYRVLRQ